MSRRFPNWLKWKGISHETSAPYSPDSSGRAERLQKFLMDIARCNMDMISDRNECEILYYEAVKTSNFLRNAE